LAASPDSPNGHTKDKTDPAQPAAATQLAYCCPECGHPGILAVEEVTRFTFVSFNNNGDYEYEDVDDPGEGDFVGFACDRCARGFDQPLLIETTEEVPYPLR